MFTLRDLMRPPHDLLRYVPETPRREATAFTRVLITSDAWEVTAPAGSALAIIPPAGAELEAHAAGEAMYRLTAQGVIAVALASALPHWPDGIAAAARRLNIALLSPAEADELDPSRLREHIRDLQAVVSQAQHEQNARLTALAMQLDDDPAGAGDRLATWLHEELSREDATAELVEPHEGPPAILAGSPHAEEAYRRVLTGQTPTENVPGPPHVTLNRASTDGAPYDVLVAASPWAWTPHLVSLARSTSRAIIHARREATADQLKGIELSLRITILQALMAGSVGIAQQLSARLPSGRLAGEDARMAVLECARPEDRPAAVRAAEQATQRRALVTMCPARRRQVLLSIPKELARTDREARALLAPLAGEGGRSVGLSSVGPYASTVYSYTTARRALVQARHAPEHIAVHAGGTLLAAELPQGGYAAWRLAMQARLTASRAVPAHLRNSWVHTVLIALAYGSGDAARMMGEDDEGKVTHSTVNRRRAAVMGAMGLDPTQLTHRAVAQLALQPPPPGTDTAPAVPSLAALLDTTGPRRWAREILRPLEEDPAALDFLATWIRCGTDQTATGAAAGIRRDTVRDRIDRIAVRLALPLTEPGGAMYETLWALTITGRLAAADLPDPVGI